MAGGLCELQSSALGQWGVSLAAYWPRRGNDVSLIDVSQETVQRHQ